MSGAKEVDGRNLRRRTSPFVKAVGIEKKPKCVIRGSITIHFAHCILSLVATHRKAFPSYWSAGGGTRRPVFWARRVSVS